MAENRLATARARSDLIAFLVTLVIGALIGLHAWSDSVVGSWTRGHASEWQFRLIGAIGLGVVLILFWTAVRTSRSIPWIFPALLATGAGLHLYRIVVFSGVLTGAAVYTTARATFPDVAWLPLYLLFYFFAMGVWGLFDRTRARTALGVGAVLRPVLLVGAFYALNATGGVLRRRPFEWALAGVPVGLALTAPPYVLGSSLADWAADARRWTWR